MLPVDHHKLEMKFSALTSEVYTLILLKSEFSLLNAYNALLYRYEYLCKQYFQFSFSFHSFLCFWRTPGRTWDYFQQCTGITPGISRWGSHPVQAIKPGELIQGKPTIPVLQYLLTTIFSTLHLYPLFFNTLHIIE